MKKLLILFLLMAINGSLIYAQSNKLDKKLEAIYELVEKQKYSDADEKLEKLLDEYPDYGKGWDYLCSIRYKDYQDAKQTDNLFGNLTITTKDKNGKDVKSKDDSITKALMSVLSSISPSKVAFSKYVYTLRKALLTSEDAYRASAILRNLYVDVEIDTNVNKKAIKYFNEAEEEFAKKNYDNATKFYKRAIDEQPNFYKASLYLGDCFFFLGNYTIATASFLEAVTKFPNLLEPRKYLIDSYAKERLYEKCLDECVKAMILYPDLSVVIKMGDAAYYSNKKIDIKWTSHPIFPNKIIDTTLSTLNQYKPSKLDITKEPWAYYENALKTIKPFCNTKGIINQTNTQQLNIWRYLVGKKC